MSATIKDIEPRDVPEVDTKYRRIKSKIPHPESIPIIEQLRKFEPRSMGGQPPILWDRAEGLQVYDKWGNMWLDWSSGVLVTNAGHSHPKICQAMLDQINHSLIHNYCFPSEIRANLVEVLGRVAPEGLSKTFLLTTGSEACECAIKLVRTNGIKVGGEKKIKFVTFVNAFHGRTLGSQMAGGISALKEWIVNVDRDMVQVPFPDGFRGKDTSFEGFLGALKQQGIEPETVAGVMTETYQGGNSSFAPPEFIKKLRQWCDENQALLVFDEVQAGFGRTGKYWGFEHYETVPDLICCGKGISSGMPLSAVIGRSEILDLYPPGSMTSTHTGNPVCAVAALVNLQLLEEENLVDNAQKMGGIMQAELRRIGKRFPDHIGTVHGKGLVASLHMVKPGGVEPNPELASDIVLRAVGKGIMLFAPVGYGGASVKLSPPLSINEEALSEGLAVIEEAVEEACS